MDHVLHMACRSAMDAAWLSEYLLLPVAHMCGKYFLLEVRYWLCFPSTQSVCVRWHCIHFFLSWKTLLTCCFILQERSHWTLRRWNRWSASSHWTCWAASGGAESQRAEENTRQVTCNLAGLAKCYQPMITEMRFFLEVKWLEDFCRRTIWTRSSRTNKSLSPLLTCAL